jgi:hypothetical protein
MGSFESIYWTGSSFFRRVLITYSLRRFPILISSLALVVQQFNIKSYKGNGKSKRHSHL